MIDLSTASIVSEEKLDRCCEEKKVLFLYFHRVCAGEKLEKTRRRGEKRKKLSSNRFCVTFTITNVLYPHHQHNDDDIQTNYLHNARCRVAPTSFFSRINTEREKILLSDARRTATHTSRMATEPLSSTSNLVTIVSFLFSLLLSIWLNSQQLTNRFERIFDAERERATVKLDYSTYYPLCQSNELPNLSVFFSLWSIERSSETDEDDTVAKERKTRREKLGSETWPREDILSLYIWRIECLI